MAFTSPSSYKYLEMNKKLITSSKHTTIPLASVVYVLAVSSCRQFTQIIITLQNVKAFDDIQPSISTMF
jgi:hypothetical protein